MTRSKSVTFTALVLAAATGAACGSDSQPTTPTPVAANVTAPALDAPGSDEQLDTLRPTLVVRNATADQTGTRMYEFQISDNNGFTASTSGVPGLASTVGKVGVPEGANGKDQFQRGNGSSTDDTLLLACARRAGFLDWSVVGDRNVSIEARWLPSGWRVVRPADSW